MTAFDLQNGASGILLGTRAGEHYRAGESTCRAWHESTGTTSLRLHVATGGVRAEQYLEKWRYSIYGRDELDGANLVLLHRAPVRRYPGAPRELWPMWDWRDVILDVHGLRFVVVSLECLVHHDPSAAAAGADYSGALGTRCPHALWIKSAAVTATDGTDSDLARWTLDDAGGFRGRANDMDTR